MKFIKINWVCTKLGGAWCFLFNKKASANINNWGPCVTYVTT